MIITLPITAKEVNNEASMNVQSNSVMQGIAITGTVTDRDGQPLPGASIEIKGASQGTITDTNGIFTIQVPNDNTTLVFSYIGFSSQEIIVGNQRSIHVTLLEDVRAIEEVVIIGYGTVKKSDLTGSVSSVAPKSFLDQPSSSISSVLSGRAAGVTVRKSNGAPGGSVMLRIRGANSLLGDNSPLVVVDGNYGGIPSMYDIESLEVLKDASATAIYGSRGANGVILVKTKRGTLDTKPTVRLYSDVSFNDIVQRYDLMNAYEYAEYNNSVGAYPFTSQEIESFRNNKGTDWQDVIFRTGVTQAYKAIVSGGSKNVRYYISPAWSKATGVVENTQSGPSYSLSAKVDMDVSKRVLLQVESGVSYGQSLNPNMLQGGSKTSLPLMSAIAWSPTVPVYNDDGTLRRIGIGSGTSLNPLLITTQEHMSYSTGGSAVANLQVKIIEGLVFDAKGSVSVGMGGGRNFESREYLGSRTEASQSSYESKSWLLNAYLSYNKTFADVHNFSAMAGFEETKSESNSFSATANDLPLESVKWYNLAMAAPNIGVGSGYSNGAMRSFFGRVNYNYANRYLLTANIRTDGSSKFRGDNQFSTFPSVALAWRISEEGFMENQQVFQNLKIRGGWGVTGSQAIGTYATYSPLGTQDWTWGTVQYPGYKGNAGGNPNLKWESTKQTSFGIDVTTFDNRLSVALEYYDKKTEDLLAPVSVPSYNGGGSVTHNIGSVQNKGFEATINYDIIRAKNFAYEVNLNGSINNNKVIEIGEEDRLYGERYADGIGTVSPFIMIPGYPIGTIFGLKYLGIWQQNEADEAAKYGLQPGDYKYDDLDGNYTINGDDYQVLGNSNAKFTWGFNNHFTYKNIHLNVLFEGVHGRDVINWSYMIANERIDFTQAYTHRAARNRWTPDNPNAEFARIGAPNLNPLSSQYMQNGSYVKLRNISVAYQVPKSWISFVNINVSVSAQNLLTITKYKGYDPEISSTAGADASTGMDWFAYPNARSFSFGISLEY